MHIFPKTKFPLGLDISDHSLKAVQLEKSGDQIRFKAVSRVVLQENTVRDGEISNPAEFQKSFTKLISSPKYGRFEVGEIVACLPDTKTFIKYIELGRSEDIKAEVRAELEKNVPIALADLYYDHQILESIAGTSCVLIGAAPKALVNQYKAVFDELNLSLVALEIEPISICRSILAEESPRFKGSFQKNYGILDIGSMHTNMSIYSHNTLLLSASVPITGHETTRLIADQLAISYDQAEKAKIICGVDENRANGVIKAVLDGLIGSTTKKIGDIINYYYDHYEHRGPLNCIFLCGGGSNIKNLDKILTENFLIEVKKSNPLMNIDEKQSVVESIFMDIIGSYALAPNGEQGNEAQNIARQSNEMAFSTAIGLALRNIFIKD